MARLVDPDHGVTVQVDDTYAEVLKDSGWTEPKGTAKSDTKPAARKAAAKSDD